MLDAVLVEAPQERRRLPWREGIALLQVVDEGVNLKLCVGVSERDKRFDEPPPTRIVDKRPAILRELLARAASVEGPALFVCRRDIEPVDALRADQKRFGSVQVLDLELVADVQMVTQLAGLEGASRSL